jgi:hypothetical protein
MWIADNFDHNSDAGFVSFSSLRCPPLRLDAARSARTPYPYREKVTGHSRLRAQNYYTLSPFGPRGA